jgi:hypothetical protein
MTSRHQKIVGFALIVGMAAGLAGCGSMFGESEYADDPLYGNGYTDGCGSGTAYVPGQPSTLIRDAEGWGKSKAYRAGWKKGFNACKVTSGSQPSNLPDDAYGRRNGPSGY